MKAPTAQARTINPNTLDTNTTPDATKATKTSPQLVMGLAAGYHYGDVRPFIASLRESGYTGRLVLFVSDTTRDLDRIQAHDVICVLVNRDAYTTAHGAEIPWNALRFFIYSDYLAIDRTPYTHILHADIRDIIFQRPPFAAPSNSAQESISGELTITLEDQRMTIGTCPYMTQWSCGQLGHEAWQAMSHHPISCSGTVMANHEHMHRYLESMKAALLPHNPAKGMAGYDQAVHNHLLRTGALSPFRTVDNGGPIFTLGYYDGIPRMDANGIIYNDNNEIPNIIHQYDRIPELFKAIRTRYAPKKRPKIRKPYFTKDAVSTKA